jgi:hypothetical protein
LGLYVQNFFVLKINPLPNILDSPASPLFHCVLPA